MPSDHDDQKLLVVWVCLHAGVGSPCLNKKSHTGEFQFNNYTTIAIALMYDEGDSKRVKLR